MDTPLKAVAQHQTVGQSLPRVDMPSKVFAELVYVHDMRMPGMLHGRVIRPPYAGADSGDFIGRTLDRVDAQSIAHIPGIHAVVVQGDFVGVVAEREEHAEQAMRELVVHWKPWPGMPQTDDLENAIRRNPSTPREVVNEGQVDQALADASHTLQRTMSRARSSLRCCRRYCRGSTPAALANSSMKLSCANALGKADTPRSQEARRIGGMSLTVTRKSAWS
jgi:nicotinate dehydrogenase subunit B